MTPSNYEDPPWKQEAGPTVFEPFPTDTPYFGDRQRVWMVNFRVRVAAGSLALAKKAALRAAPDQPKLP